MVSVLNEVDVEGMAPARILFLISRASKPRTAVEHVIGHRLLDTSEFMEEFGCRALPPGIKGGRAGHSYLDSVRIAHDAFVR